MAAKCRGVIVENLLALVLWLTSMAIGPIVGSACAGWLIYSKPAFEGTVVDTGTGEPIEGAVVAATYYERYYTPISSDIEPIKVDEARTDKDGRFHISAYTTIISPLRTVDRVAFTIFRSDYASVNRMYLENIFTGKPDEDHKEVAWWGKQDLVIRFMPGIVTLPRLKTKEEMRKNAGTIVLPEILPKDSLLRKAVDEAERRSSQ